MGRPPPLEHLLQKRTAENKNYVANGVERMDQSMICLPSDVKTALEKQVLLKDMRCFLILLTEKERP